VTLDESIKGLIDEAVNGLPDNETVIVALLSTPDGSSPPLLR
jgi:hypothetical protein